MQSMRENGVDVQITIDGAARKANYPLSAFLHSPLLTLSFSELALLGDEAIGRRFAKLVNANRVIDGFAHQECRAIDESDAHETSRFRRAYGAYTTTFSRPLSPDA